MMAMWAKLLLTTSDSKEPSLHFPPLHHGCVRQASLHDVNMSGYVEPSMRDDLHTPFFFFSHRAALAFLHQVSRGAYLLPAPCAQMLSVHSRCNIRCL